ncbi:MAG: hypothetical protein DRN57_03665 [Thermoplasmata archaeon]|nr:MAG: hypothetical protein DRN57_03665 [Thermoplasmata archaeon]
MAETSVIYLFCEICGEETPHRILRGSISSDENAGFDGTVQCVPCGSVHSAHLDMEKPVKVPAIISEGSSSTKTSMELYPHELLRVGEEMMWDGHNLRITSIESGGRRLDRAQAEEVSCLWLKNYDTIDVKISVVEGANTRSQKLTAAPDEEFAVGDLMDLGRTKVVVTKIKTERRMVYREGSPVEARRIKRIYTKRVNERVH